MKWENLRKQCCPYCSNPLIKNADTGEVECSRCTFRIEKHRLRSIAEHRAYPEKEGVISIKWQYLKTGKCPLCTKDLYPDKTFSLMRCIDANCTFKIREDRMQIILDDPNHPANRFEVSPTPPLA